MNLRVEITEPKAGERLVRYLIDDQAVPLDAYWAMVGTLLTEQTRLIAECLGRLTITYSGNNNSIYEIVNGLNAIANRMGGPRI